MKKTRRLRLLALALAFTMAVPSTAYAAPGGWNNKRQNSRYQNNWYQNSWLNSMKQTETTTETEMEVVESAETVVNPEMLRATTYELTTTETTTTTTSTWGIARSSESEQAETTTVKYFPVTMYDYDGATINAATDKLDDDLTVREGFYFSDGGAELGTTTKVTNLSGIVAGKYYIQNIRAFENNVDSWLQAHADNKIYAVAQEDATVWTLNIENGSYYLTTIIDGETHYMVVGTGAHDDGYTTDKTPVNLSIFSEDASGVQIGSNGYYLCQWGGKTELDFGGYNVDNDGGNGMYFYPVSDEGEVSDTPIAPGEVTKMTAGYEEWNHWTKTVGKAEGDLIYTGLVQNTLVDDQIVFNVNEGGIFNNDTTVKDVYEYVGLPFVLDKTTGVYSFDSDKNGVYFADANGNKVEPKSGTEEAPNNLYFAEGKTQLMNQRVGDGSLNAWFPYNATHSSTYIDGYDNNTYGNYDSGVNYHFGMRADIPFSMTANGRVKSTDDESDAITFTFSGDDDVWVFVDGNLVIDLGGIHNRLDATIDFAANTITYSEENAQDNDKTTGSYNDPNFASTQKLFTDSEGTGLINMTRDAFAMDPDHEMQVFYLERGKGTSNCRIEFNLPMNDAVIITKDATKSWSQAAEDADIKNDPDMEDPGVDSLTATEQAIVNNIDFGFTLYKKNESGTFDLVANTNYYLLDAEGNVISIESTDENGHFYLKNAQSAKFITEIPSDGVTYYVVEDDVPKGFITPDFNFDGEAVGGFSYGDGSGNTKDVTQGNLIPEQIIPIPKEGEEAFNKSYEVTVRGSVESNDSVEFICTNYLDAELPNPTAIAMEDIIVIDYGLSVQIDPLANDMFRGDSREIVYVGGADVTLTETIGANGVVQGSWTTDGEFESGKVELNNVKYAVAEDGTVTRDTLVYTLDKQLTEVEVLTYIVEATGEEIQGATGDKLTQYDYAIGKIYIVPATTMYYEENFNGLVKYEGNGWKEEIKEESFVNPYQEPGVVGTTDDSTYGSDVAYLNDSRDSNGTSYYGDTTSKAIRFSYTFTGTGTSFFARTSATTGYMQIKLYSYDANGDEVLENITYRDTYYQDTNNSEEDAAGTLYNIPVYTESDLPYGTYKVVATIAKKGTAAAGGAEGSGNEFYLDGIRIMEPLNEDDTRKANDGTEATLTDKALAAYAKDGEANMAVLTLRQKLITDAVDPWGFAVLTDTNGEIVTAKEYVSIGPKEEVYLNPGQSVTFSVKYWQPGAFKMYMGMKAPFGAGKIQVGQTTYELKNATDCYYDITDADPGLITETGHIKDENGHLLYKDTNGNIIYETADGYYYYSSDDSEITDVEVLEGLTEVTGQYYVATYTLKATEKIVSLTNIKITGNYEFEIVGNENINIGDDQGEGEE